MTDQTLEVKIEVRSPLLLGTDRSYQFFNETRTYIPGGTLRGSLARLMRESNADGDFETLFGPEAILPIFENLHPSWSESFTYPIPLSARTCKHHGGFRASDDDRSQHGVGDILIQQAVFESIALDDEGVAVPFLYAPRCPVCGSEVKQPPFQFYDPVGRSKAIQVPVRRFSRTAIDRRRYTAADQLLYTLETVEPGKLEGDQLFFRGAVRYEGYQSDILQRWLPRLEWLGQGRSRGLGQVKLTLVEDEEAAMPSLSERLAAFNQAVWQEWQFYQRVAGATLPAEGAIFFSLDLVSPTILTRYGLPWNRPEPADLGLEANAAKICRAFIDQEIIGGWHLGGRLPRRTMLATAAGSTYLIETKGLSSPQLAEKLAPLETAGLGEERSRGFGRVLISSPFHYAAEVIL